MIFTIYVWMNEINDEVFFPIPSLLNSKVIRLR